MKFYIDTEFLEGKQEKRFLGFKVGETKPTIDLISIGVVSEDGREYYAVSKEFNLREAWNRWQPRTGQGGRNDYEPKEYWIRENVLKPIFKELLEQEYIEWDRWQRLGMRRQRKAFSFTYQDFKYLLKEHGKTNLEIKLALLQFVLDPQENGLNSWLGKTDDYFAALAELDHNIEFYTYYGAYDHVALSWLYGKMINLPKSFPMYTRDLKQIIDEVPVKYEVTTAKIPGFAAIVSGVDPYYSTWKEHKDYPKQTKEHNALADAQWNKKLHDFILKIKEDYGI